MEVAPIAAPRVRQISVARCIPARSQRHTDRADARNRLAFLGDGVSRQRRRRSTCAESSWESACLALTPICLQLARRGVIRSSLPARARRAGRTERLPTPWRPHPRPAPQRSPPKAARREERGGRTREREREREGGGRGATLVQTRESSASRHAPPPRSSRACGAKGSPCSAAHVTTMRSAVAASRDSSRSAHVCGHALARSRVPIAASAD